MAICWERLSRQLFTVLILDAFLVVLVPLPFGPGCGTRLYRLLITAFLVCFSQSIQAQGRRRLLKTGPAMGRRKRGEHEREVFPSRKEGSGDFHRENFRFRKDVDAFLSHLECNFGL